MEARTNSDIDEEAHRIVDAYQRGEMSETDTRQALGELLSETQIAIFAVASWRRHGGLLPIGISHQEVANAVLVRLWKRLQRPGENPPFDLDRFHAHRYSFMGWAYANAKNAVPSIVDTENDSQRFRRGLTAQYEQSLATSNTDEKVRTDYSALDYVIDEAADRSSRIGFAFRCHLIRTSYGLPTPPGIDRRHRKAAAELISRLRENASDVRPLLRDPLVRRATAHLSQDELQQATALPDLVLASVVIESLCSRPTINRQLRSYRSKLDQMNEELASGYSSPGT